MPARCKEREKLSATSFVEIPALPVLAVRGQLCFRCYGSADKIRKCAGCKRAGYCSRECQKLDWATSHKKHCMVLRDINQLEEHEECKAKTWDQYRRSLLRYVRYVHERVQSGDAQYIIQAQAYCVACRRSALQCARQNIALDPCARCHLIFSCNECQASHPDVACAAYSAYNKIALFRIDLFEDVENASVIACTSVPRTTHIPLRDCAGWYEYFVTVSDKDFIAERVLTDLSQISESARQGSLEQQEEEERRRLFLLLATDNLTMPLSIVSAVEKMGWVGKSSLRIHLLGPTQREFLAINIFEEILHLLPKLKILEMTAIGPSSILDKGETKGYQAMDDVPCCATCRSLDRKRPFASYKGLYHEFVSSEQYERPDLVVAFNSGCADGDDADTHWKSTIKVIIEQGTPALFTTYNESEATHEQAQMHMLGAKFLVNPAQNKWRGLVPSPEFLDTEFELWYQNSHWYIIQGRTE